MEHYIINADTGNVLKVKEHKFFYSEMGTSKTESELNKIGLGKGALKKIMEFINEKNPNTSEIEVFIMNNFPIMKASIYGGERNITFSYFRGTSTYKAVDEILSFCAARHFPNIEIFNVSNKKHVFTRWDEIKEDDSHVRLKLGSIMTKDIKDIACKLASIKIADTHYIFDPDKATDELNKLKGKIDAGYVNPYISTLGGKERASIMLTVTLEPKEKWPNNIKDNATIFQFDIARNGYVENFRGEWKPAMRKFIAKDIDDVIMRINDYLKKGKIKHGF